MYYFYYTSGFQLYAKNTPVFFVQASDMHPYEWLVWDSGRIM